MLEDLQQAERSWKTHHAFFDELFCTQQITKMAKEQSTKNETIFDENDDAQDDPPGL